MIHSASSIIAVLVGTSLSFSSFATSALIWGACPEGQIFPYHACKWDCASMSFPMDRNDASKGTVTSFIRRGYVNEPSGKSMWGIAGGPGYSTSTFVPIFDYFMSVDPSLTSYLVDARGIGLSSPLSYCSNSPKGFFDPYNETYMETLNACNLEMIALDKDKYPYFTTYHAAQDLLGVMQEINPDTISIYSASYGTFFTNTLLQLPGFRGDVVVYDGPLSANRWPLENNARMQTMVTLDGIRMCAEESAVCREHLGELGHIPQMVKDAIVDRSLPCMSKLAWLQEDNGNFITSLFNNFMNPNDKKALLGPFWHRLYRCSDSDVEQLNHFYNTRMADMMQMGEVNLLEYSPGYAANVGSSELYSLANPESALSYDQVIDYHIRTFTIEGGDLTVSFARSVSQWPYPAANPITQGFANSTPPVHIFVGTLDANTPVGQAKWVQDGMGGGVDSKIYLVPYANHGLVDPNNPCINGVIINILSLKTNIDTSCIATSVPAPDWDGSENATRNDLSQKFFGTRDLWNNGFVVDASDQTGTSSTGSECDWNSSDVNSLVIAIVVPLGVVIVALAIAVIVLATSQRRTGLLDKGSYNNNSSL